LQRSCVHRRRQGRDARKKKKRKKESVERET
jgi:hypothetical protein